LEAIRCYLSAFIEGVRGDAVKLYETEKNTISLVATKKRCELLKKMDGSSCSLEYKKGGGGGGSFVFKKDGLRYLVQNGSNMTIGSDQIDELCRICGSLNEMKDILTRIYWEHVLKGLEVFHEKIAVVIDYVTCLDVAFTRAVISKKYHYCRPSLASSMKKSFFRAKGMRHPLIEQIQKEELYVTNDLSLGSSDKDKVASPSVATASDLDLEATASDFVATRESDKDKEKTNGVLLYGTNAVGKTSFIRAIGVCVIMAQAGLFVPCDSFEYKPYHAIFTRILGNDNLFKGLSSFSVEMSELRTILKQADENSLILGDELCSGTESISAKSIFVAGIQNLIQKRSSFIFATHLHEIAEYEEIQEAHGLSLLHMSVFYDREKDRLIYDRKLKPGVGSNMYGLEVCKSLHLPEDFLEQANKIRMKYNPESGSLLDIKPSHFNARKLMSLCEKCGKKRGEEMHHIREQSEADQEGWIRDEKEGLLFHKNHVANLMSLCEACHRVEHAERRTKTEKTKTKSTEKTAKSEKTKTTQKTKTNKT
jgi:DNA mismatch repair protein MutS